MIKMKKRVLALLTATMMMLSLFAGCGNSKVESYKSMAQGFIDGNDKAAAIKILQQGISETDNEELKTMLEELSKVDYSSYMGTWAENGLCWDGGGLTLDVTVENDKMTLACALTQAAPASRVAEIQKEINITDIVDSSVEIPYDDDSWGNSGKLKITFAENAITCEFSDIVTDNLAQWGFYESMYSLIKNDNAHELLIYTPEEYDAKYGEPEPQQPTYDTSKASGILASLGMTEEEFRNNCYPMQRVTGLGSITTGDTFFKGEKYTIQDFDMLNRMSDFPTDYENSSYKIVFDVEDKAFNSEGLACYEGELSNTSIVVYDRRDNTKSPNISINDEICAYCVFTGCYTFSNGQDYLAFVLISVDK